MSSSFGARQIADCETIRAFKPEGAAIDTVT